MKITIQNASLEDRDAIYRLVRSERRYLLYRSKKEITGMIREFVVARDGGRIIGCAAFEDYSPKIGELRSLVILPEYRGKHIGKKLIRTLLKRRHKNQKVFIVTSKVSYFERLGFRNCLNEKYVLFKR